MNVAALRVLYGATVAELVPPIAAGLQRGLELIPAIRPDEPGVADRLEQLAQHLDGVRCAVLRARAAAMRATDDSTPRQVGGS